MINWVQKIYWVEKHVWVIYLSLNLYWYRFKIMWLHLFWLHFDEMHLATDNWVSYLQNHLETVQNAVISPFTLTQSVTEYILISIYLDITSWITMAEQLYPARTFLLIFKRMFWEIMNSSDHADEILFSMCHRLFKRVGTYQNYLS